MPEKRRKFDQEFREGAVRIVRAGIEVIDSARTAHDRRNADGRGAPLHRRMAYTATAREGPVSARDWCRDHSGQHRI